MDSLDELGWHVLNVQNRLQSVRDNWEMPLHRLKRHISYNWYPIPKIFFSRAQIQRIHKHLLHPSASKLYQFLQKASPEEMTPETKSFIQEISDTCKTCQKFAPKALSFQIRETNNVTFNHRLLIDLMWLHGKPVLHIVDEGTNFSAAKFLPGEDAKTIWSTFLKTWSHIYIGFPDQILTDQGKVFKSEYWKSACANARIDLRHSGTKSHNSLGKGETYHAFLRRIYNKAKSEHPDVADDLVLSMSVKAMNDTAGPQGLVPTLLVFGVLPRIIEKLHDLPDQRERFRIMDTAKKEFQDIIAKQQLDRGLRKNPPPASEYRFQTNQPVYVYREKLKHWTGPHLVMSCDKKQVLVNLGKREGASNFNISQIKPAKLPSFSELKDNIEESPQIYITEVIKSNDPRAKNFDEAKKKEILGLIEKGTFKIVLKSEAGDDPNIIPCRFVLAIKNVGTGEEILKARFVLAGHRDKEKEASYITQQH